MIVGVKYCGGCNPRFSRKELVEKLKTDTDVKIVFEHVSKNKAFDLILLINGCEKNCLLHTLIDENISIINISTPLNYNYILNLINKKINHI